MADSGDSSGSAGPGDGTSSGGDDSSGGDSTGEPMQGIPVLGGLSHSIDNVEVEVIVAEQLMTPTDVEFNPEAPEQLWITSRDDHSVLIVIDPGTPTQQVIKKEDQLGGGTHFLARPAAIAFGAPGLMATAQQEDEVTQPDTPADFMGPTLWPTALDVFQAGHASHMDMLHNSPSSSGIAWEAGNVYWVFDGAHGSLTRYDFNSDHGLGGADHTDGEIYRAADGELSYVPDIAAHIVYDAKTHLLYSVDPGNNRIVVLNTTTGKIGDVISPNYDGAIQRYIDGMELTTLVDGMGIEADLDTPSGLELHNGYLFVADNQTSTIAAFDLDGTLVDWLDTEWPAGTLMGIAFDEQGRLYAVDAAGNRVLRISAAQ
jgi:DNA-binding beta-propeller fold protein YncE